MKTDSFVSVWIRKRELVKERAAAFFDQIEYMIVTEEIEKSEVTENIEEFENTRETGQQMSENPVSEEDISELKESEPTTEKEILDYRWQDMPDLEVPYFPELGYHQSMRIRAITLTDYVCWKDLLVIGNRVYRRTNGIYERTEERPQDWQPYTEI